LTVLINGQHVAGGPFPLYVSIHPAQLGRPVKIWTRISRPSGITANSKGEIIMSSLINVPTLIKFNAEGKRVVVVKNGGLARPRRVACDDEDNVYCLDQKSSQILTCNSEGENVQLRDIELEKNSPGRSALTVINNKLYMAEVHSGVIKVYDKQLLLLSVIKHKNMAVDDIAPDIHQNLYVSDLNNSCVHVFSKDGVHLRSFGHDKEDLKQPRGICVHGQYVYLAEVSSHCVFVFTTDGDYVSSFGQRGSKKGEFDWPVGIHVDRDGLVGVIDLYNNRLQFF